MEHNNEPERKALEDIMGKKENTGHKGMSTRAVTKCDLTLYHTIPTYNNLYKKPLENIVRKEENAHNQNFLFFPTMFSTLSKTNFKFSGTFILSSAYSFSLDQSFFFFFL